MAALKLDTRDVKVRDTFSCGAKAPSMFTAEVLSVRNVAWDQLSDDDKVLNLGDRILVQWKPRMDTKVPASLP